MKRTFSVFVLVVVLVGVAVADSWSGYWKLKSQEDRLALCHALVQGMVMAGPVLGPFGDGILSQPQERAVLEAALRFYEKNDNPGFWLLLVSFVDAQFTLHPEYDFSQAFFGAFSLVRRVP